jgi:hypothetical protein
MKKKLLFSCTLLLFFGFSFAHQPRIVFDQVHNETNPIIVTSPEISQAFYGNLHGQEDIYHLSMDTGYSNKHKIVSKKIRK